MFFSTDLTQHATILAHMMGVIATEKVAAPLFDPSVPANSGMNNASYVQHYMEAGLPTFTRVAKFIKHFLAVFRSK